MSLGADSVMNTFYDVLDTTILPYESNITKIYLHQI